MEFEGNRLQLLEIASKVKKLANDNSPIEMLRGILLECNAETGEISIIATDFEASIIVKGKASVTKSGKIVINAKFLVGMLSLLSGEHVRFSTADSKIVKISSGKCIYTMVCFSGEDYPMPLIPFPEETCKISDIRSIAKRTVFASAKSESNPILQCISLKIKQNAVYAAASDGYCMMLVKSDKECSGSQEFLLPVRSFQILASIADNAEIYNVGTVGNETVFTSKTMLFSIKQQQGSFINTDMIIKSMKPKYTAVTNTTQFYKALSLVSVGAGTMPINIFFSDKMIRLQCDGDYGVSLSEVHSNTTGDMPKVGFFYNSDYLKHLFYLLNGPAKLEIDAKGMMLIRSKEEIYFQLPMIKPVKKKKEAEKRTVA